MYANQSVILCQVFTQAVNPEAGIAGLDFQEQLCCGQLVVKVKGCRSICTANKLKISTAGRRSGSGDSTSTRQSGHLDDRGANRTQTNQGFRRNQVAAAMVDES